MSEKRFTKGDAVTHVADWDGKGTVTFRHAVVHSCGKKQMILVDAATGRELGRHFDPRTGADTRNWSESTTLPRLSDDEAAEAARELATRILEEKRSYLARRLERNPDEARSVGEELAKLHEPRGVAHGSVSQTGW